MKQLRQKVAGDRKQNALLIKAYESPIPKSPITYSPMFLAHKKDDMVYMKRTFTIDYFYWKCITSGEQFSTIDLDIINNEQVYRQYDKLILKKSLCIGGVFAFGMGVFVSAIFNYIPLCILFLFIALLFTIWTDVVWTRDHMNVMQTETTRQIEQAINGEKEEDEKNVEECSL